jgi:hypothetical protein
MNRRPNGFTLLAAADGFFTLPAAGGFTVIETMVALLAHAACCWTGTMRTAGGAWQRGIEAAVLFCLALALGLTCSRNRRPPI